MYLVRLCDGNFMEIRNYMKLLNIALNNYKYITPMDPPEVVIILVFDALSKSSNSWIYSWIK